MKIFTFKQMIRMTMMVMMRLTRMMINIELLTTIFIKEKKNPLTKFEKKISNLFNV